MKRDFAIGAAWSAVGGWIEQGVGAVIFLMIARLVGVEDFGIAAMAFAFLFLGEFLVRDTLTEAIVERRVLEDGRLEATFATLIGFSLVIVIALAVVSQLAASAYGEPTVGPLLLAASPTVLMIGCAGVSTALLRRQLAYRTLAIRAVVGVSSGGIVGITMALNHFGAWSIVGQRLTEVGINSITSFTAAGWTPKRWPRRQDYALLRGLGPRVVLLRSVTLVIGQTPTVALGLFADPRAAGLFAFASRFIEIVRFLVVKPLQSVAQSVIAAMRRQHAATDQFFLDLNNLVAWAAFPAFLGLGLIAAPLINVLLGKAWLQAAVLLAVLSISGAVSALAAIQEAYLLAMDRIGPFLRASGIDAALGVVIVGFMSQYGPTAAAVGVTLRTLLAMPLRTKAALAPEALAPVRLIGALAAPLLAASAMAVAVALWRFALLGRIPDVIFLTSAVALGAGTVCLLLFGLMPNARSRLQTFFHAGAEGQS